MREYINIVEQLLSEAKKVYDIRHEESTLKYWGGEYKYINPENGFFFHYNKGELVLHSAENDRYSSVVVHGEKSIKGGNKDRTVPFLWNMLNGLVDFRTKTVTIAKESVGNTERQRSMHNIKELQQAFKELKPYGLDDSFIVKGVPKNIPKTVGQVLEMSDYTDAVISQKPITMFHGTSTKAYEEIAKYGLRPGNTPGTYNDLIPNYSEHNVYLATTEKSAEFYGKRQAKKDGSDGYVILSIKVPDPAKIIADDQLMHRWAMANGETIRDENGWVAADKEELFKRGTEADRIRNSGRMSGEFGYRGIILPNFISVVRKGRIR